MRAAALLCLILLPALLVACGGNSVDVTPGAPSPVRAATVAPTLPAAPTDTAIRPTDTAVLPNPTPAPPTATPGPPPAIAVLAYHHFDVPAAGDYNVPLTKFELHLKWLKHNDYDSVSPQQLVDAIHGRATLPAHPVLITFDDDNSEQYTEAAPLLEKYGYRGAFFIDTVTIGKRYFMTADQLRDLEHRGHTIGTHTWDHRDLAILTMDEVKEQLDRSESDIEAVLGHKPLFMSYPFGAYNPEIVAELKARGYHGAFRLRASDDPVVDPAFMIHRQIIAGVWSVKDFANNVHWMEP
ncbi:MAG TPA: polysaccharide deacetylase family protein [Chloroflexia bacterium]|jgi:peptidoglycan/xylan/chitin deacetylase (PgdA/CDA1 family)|nr:polysaccharide deacetylase family protein [Chloroflexia bacterium]